MSLEEAGLLQENGVVRFVSESFGEALRAVPGRRISADTLASGPIWGQE